MALIAHYKCDQNRRDATTLIDSSGHANDHSMTLEYPSTSIGFGHKRAFTGWNGFYARDALNEADFLTFGECTIMAWISIMHFPSGPTPEIDSVIGFGDENSELASGNLCWSMRVDQANEKFGMIWEQGAGVNVEAWSGAGAISRRTPNMEHFAVIRTINGANRDVKFVRNGIDLGSDVLGLTAPDGTLAANAQVDAFRHPNYAFSSGRLEASVRHLRFYDNALTVPQVKAIHDAEIVELTRASKIMQILNTYRGGESGSIYAPVNTGTKLAEGVRGFSGWKEDRI